MKGQIHTEWVISLGIFLLYVLGMIIFIKPGFVSYYGEKDLINIVESGFKEKYYWNVKKVPLFVVEDCECLPDENKCVFYLKDRNNGWGVNPSDGYSFETDVRSGTVLWFNFSSNDQTKELVIKDIPPSPNDPNILNPCTSTNYRIGTVENVYGINNRIPDYNTLREVLNYPENKDFILKLNDKVVKNKDPPQGVNIYVKEWDDFYVDRDGNRESVRVSITVW